MFTYLIFYLHSYYQKFSNCLLLVISSKLDMKFTQGEKVEIKNDYFKDVEWTLQNRLKSIIVWTSGLICLIKPYICDPFQQTLISEKK